MSELDAKEITKRTLRNMNMAINMCEILQEHYIPYSSSHRAVTNLISNMLKNLKDLEHLLQMVTEMKTDIEFLENLEHKDLLKERTILKRQLTIANNKLKKLKGKSNAK